MYHELPTFEAETYCSETYRDFYRSESLETLTSLGLTRPRVEVTEEETGHDESPWEAWVNRQDEEAARALVRQLSPVVLRSVRRRRPMHADEQDLAQIIFSKIFSKLPQYSGLVPLEHWVSRIAVNTCLNQIKYEMARPESSLSEVEESIVWNNYAETSDETSETDREADCQLVEMLLSGLKPDERRVIQMLHIEERSAEEISRKTGWSVSLVKVKAFRARNKMRKRWSGVRP
ncbi:MAG: polymerase, sigma-24 subunit, subfamily [Verrucomicrobiales bacterium]|nr:polymerase, sigma-24 subunit, subfamily [Verrucomicrobiales bacterium]